MSEPTGQTAADAVSPHPLRTASRLWSRAYRVEIGFLVIGFVVLAMFSGQRFLRQSAAPHFVYQAQAWLDGRTDIDPNVLPNIEDWACVRMVNGEKTRCPVPTQPGDIFYSSFPAFPSVLMLPFVWVNGYQFNDTSFGVFLAALALGIFYSVLRLFREHEGTARSEVEDTVITVLLGFGTVFFYCSIRGEVWFLAEVMGVGLTALYARNAVGARRPVLAGLFWSMAVLTRAPLFFTGIFFVLEALCPTKGHRLDELTAFTKKPKPGLKKLMWFAAGAAPLGLAAAAYNQFRFGSITEFGHRFLYFNRVNADIDVHGLFDVAYLARNLDAAFLKLPHLSLSPLQLTYDPWGLSLFLTLPVLALALVPAVKPNRVYWLLGAMGLTLVVSAMNPSTIVQYPSGAAPVGGRPAIVWLVLAATLGFLVYQGWTYANSKDAPRAAAPVLVTVLACALPGLFYQNTGYMQFGFRFSLDWTPWVMLLVAAGGWRMKKPVAIAIGVLAIVIAFWGAVGFKGYTEMVRHW